MLVASSVSNHRIKWGLLEFRRQVTFDQLRSLARQKLRLRRELWDMVLAACVTKNA
jgi:hypothetical protein